MTSIQEKPISASTAMKERQGRAIDEALRGLAAINVDPDVLRNLTSILGREAPLPRPVGCDAALRRNLAGRLSQTILAQIETTELPPCVAFDLYSPAWSCAAEQPIVPLDVIKDMALRPLKKRFSSALWALKPTMVRSADGDRLDVSVRVFAVDGGVNDSLAAWLSGLAQRLDTSGERTVARTTTKRATRGTVQREIVRLLELTNSTVTDVAADDRIAFRELRSLYQSLILSVVPLQSIVSGTGPAKKAFNLCLKEANARAAARAKTLPPMKRSWLATNEIYPLIGDIDLRVNDQRMRPPFWRL